MLHVLELPNADLHTQTVRCSTRDASPGDVGVVERDLQVRVVDGRVDLEKKQRCERV